jgi:putative acetyltransferase
MGELRLLLYAGETCDVLQVAQTRTADAGNGANWLVYYLKVLIRPETPHDYADIRKVNCVAFGSQLEATLVERLRDDGLAITSLVAVDDAGQVAGHILLSLVKLVTSESGQMDVASLAPMAVAPSHQRKGIGSMLVERGIEACRRAHYRAIIVVGHPGYYPRFGFSHAIVARLKNPFAADEAFMGLELSPGVLSSIEGRVVYPQAFDVFS